MKSVKLGFNLTHNILDEHNHTADICLRFLPYPVITDRLKNARQLGQLLPP